MIDPKFPPKAELMKMTLEQLHALRVIDPEEELILEEVVRQKTQKVPVKIEVFDKDIKGARIENPEQEQKMQEELNRRRKLALEQMGMTEEEVVQEVKKIHTPEKEYRRPVRCELCGSHGIVHRKGCELAKKK